LGDVISLKYGPQRNLIIIPKNGNCIKVKVQLSLETLIRGQIKRNTAIHNKIAIKRPHGIKVKVQLSLEK